MLSYLTITLLTITIYPTIITDQIAMEVAQATEARRKPHGRQVQLKVGPSHYIPLQRVTGLRSTRSSSLRRQHIEKQGQANAMKV